VWWQQKKEERRKETAETMAHLAALFAKREAGPPPAFLQKSLKSAASNQDGLSSPDELIEGEVKDIHNSFMLSSIVDAAPPDRLVIVVFVTSFAPPCEIVLQDLKNMSKSLKNVMVCQVDTCTNNGGALADEHGIEATPTLRFYVGGKQVHSMTAVSKDLILPFVMKWSKKAKASNEPPKA